MGKFVPKTYETILQRMIDRVVARSKLNDITDTSNVKAILAACAREMADGYYQTKNLVDLFGIDRAVGEDLDERAKDFNPVVIARKTSVKAVGNLVFTRAVAGPMNIPIGTRVMVPGSDPEVIAVTTASYVSASSTSSGNLASVMEVGGAAGNAVAATITQFVGVRPSGAEAVSNPSAFTGGVDKETDDAFRARIKAYVNSLSRCTPLALETAALDVELASGQRVVFARTLEDVVKLGKVYLYIDDGAGGAESNDDNQDGGDPIEILTQGQEYPGDVAVGGERYLYANNVPIHETDGVHVKIDAGADLPIVESSPAAGQCTVNYASGQVYLGTALVAGQQATIRYKWRTGLMKEVQKVIDGDIADPINYPGWRAAGVNVLVRVPTLITITIIGDITVKDGYNQNDVAAAVKTAIAGYINGLGIGNDVIRAEMIERAMGVAGMHDITISTPATNTVILESQLPRTSESTDITLT